MPPRPSHPDPTAEVPVLPPAPAALWLAVLLAAAVLTACAPAPPAAPEPAAAPTAAAAFAGLPAPGRQALPGFVGVDGAGVPLAVAAIGEGRAVAYLCDGEGVGRWFTGTVDGATFTLTAADGTALTATAGADSLAGTLGGAPFTLAPTAGAAGLFREEAAADGTAFVAGWILGNDGAVHGVTTGEDGQRISGAATGPDDADDGSTGDDAVARIRFQNTRCGILGLRTVFNQGQLEDALAAGDTAGVEDARLDQQVIKAQQTRNGCT